MNVTYATAETVLARLFNVSEEVQQKAFRGRVRHFRRLGAPLGPRPGKGKRVWYSQDQLYLWAFCLQLAEFGIDPVVIVELVQENWDGDILPKFKTAFRTMNSDNHLFFAATPRLMSRAPSDASRLEYTWKREKQICLGRYRCLLLINVSAMVNEMAVLRVLADSAPPKKG